MDTLTAARWQMTVSMAFHMVFAAVGIGLPLLLVIVEGLSLRTRQPHYMELARKWAKVTGLLFAVGAISGTALSFELGLLWPRYMEITGAAVGHIFGLEGFAFFIEAIFIGLYLYGWDRLTPVQHWLCGVVIAISGAVSGILILGVNAWMQLPVGFELDAAGQVIVTDPIAIFKRYAWFVMALHSTLSCYIAVAFAAAAVYAWGYLRGKRDAYHRSAIMVCLAVGAVTAILQPFSGDLLAKFVFHTQPAKFAAMEGHFETQTHASLHLGGIPDMETGQTNYAVKLPAMLSVLATHDPATTVTGLNDIPRENWPNVMITHGAFQVMIILGVALMALSGWFWLARWRRGESALRNRWLLRAIVACGSFGFVALEAGWIVTEVGRQPWVIQGILKTADAVTPAAGVPQLFYGFTALYVALAVAVLAFLRQLTAKPADAVTAPQEERELIEV
jgi:cytochrome d ubiquinol oxidase subunit I